MQTNLPELPTVILSNGLRVANYSSPHPFTFDDGSVLPRCSDERATMTMLKKHKTDRKIFESKSGVEFIKQKVRYTLSWFVAEDIRKIMHVFDSGKLPWDLIIAPLPVVDGMVTAGYDVLASPQRG